MAGQGLLLMMTDIDPEFEDQFNRWHEGEHIPRMLEVPGVLNASRYRILEGRPKYLTIYDLRDQSVLQQPEYLRLRAWGPEAPPAAREMLSHHRNLVRGVYQLILTMPDPEPADLSGARGLLMTGLEIGPEHDEEFQDWYNMEHVPSLAAVPGVLRVRRFKLNPEAPGTMGDPVMFVGLYDMVGPEVQATPEWLKARVSPWTTRIQRYRTTRVRNLYERIS